MARDKEKKEGTDEWMRSPGECGEEKGGDVGFWEKQRSIDGEKEKELRMRVWSYEHGTAGSKRSNPAVDQRPSVTVAATEWMDTG